MHGAQIGAHAGLSRRDEGQPGAIGGETHDKLAEFRTQVVKQRSAHSSVSLDYAMTALMRIAELDDSTRHTYESDIRRTIRATLGEETAKIDGRVLESFYSELRRCRVMRDGKPRIEKHSKDDELIA